jgi:hypothetical protein
MARFNPDLMQTDDGQATRRVFGTKTDTSQISEQDMYEASRDAAIELGVDPVTLAYEAGLQGDRSKPLNKMTDEERAAFTKGSIAKQTQIRQFGTPDNPQPYEAPDGTNWQNYGGKWTLYYNGYRVGDANGYNQALIEDLKTGGRVVKVGGVDGNGGSDTTTTTATKTYTASDGKEFTDQQAFVDYEISLRESTAQKNLIAEQNKAERKSAYDLLFSEFKQYGLEALVTPLKSLIEEGVSPSEFTLRLRETDAYKKRFAANAQRVAKGLRALSEAEYIGTEDQYQDVMRRYGMPESYYTKGELGIQSGFEKFLAGDVSAVELEDRIQTAQNRVVNSNPEVSKALKEFYPGISNGDILAYVLDPTNAIEQIKRKVTAAEIGGAAIQSGLRTGMARAEELGAAGITKQQAQQGFGTIAGGLQRGSQLASIYGEDPYSQAIAETEVFGLAGKTEAEKQRKKLTGLEKATFGGQTGLTTGALSQERAGAY